MGARIAVIALVGAALWAQDPQDGCSCPTEPGADSGSAPLLTINGPGGKPGLAVCGAIRNRLENGSIVASEAGVLPCGSDEPILEFDALRRAEIVPGEGRLLITELTQWPFGPDWKWIDVPLRKFVITAETPPVVTEKTVLNPPSLTPAQVKEVLSDFESLRKAKVGANDGGKLMNLVGRLLTVALTGDTAAVNAFRAMHNWLDSLEPFNAECSEMYDDAREVYRIYAESKGAPHSSDHPGN